MSLNNDPINEFKGPYRFLSNFYMVPVTYEGVQYPSSEHAYMAAKTTSEPVRQYIATIISPKDAKAYGRQVQLRTGWDAMKYDVMVTILRSKFSGPMMQSLLLNTYSRELIEGNWWNDKIWGVCLKTNVGQNLLGKALMQIRAELQAPAKLPTITVVNKHHKAEGEYIGRGSPLGNPFPIDEATGQTREVVIARYKIWLESMIAASGPTVCNELNRLVNIAYETGELRLQCFCAPKPCHGDVIKQTILTAWSQE